ncbi:MAG: hypothetical protein ACK5LT_04000 [Lachnospirales bacterium]
MKKYKNIEPFTVIDSKEYVSHSKNKISSKAILNTENIEMRFFSASKGEDIDKEIYPEETLFFCLEGKLKITFKEKDEITLNAGEMFVIEESTLYGIMALEDTKYFNILV